MTAQAMKIIYIAHPLGDGPDRSLNIARASKWVAWAAAQKVAPVCTWIVLASQWPETDAMREAGLTIDLALIDHCDEVWLCGPRVSKGMNIEATHAKKIGVPVHVLVDSTFTDGPPARPSTFDELVMRSGTRAVAAAGLGPVQRRLSAMATHHGFLFEDFLKLSHFEVAALEMTNPCPKDKLEETSKGAVPADPPSPPLPDALWETP